MALMKKMAQALERGFTNVGRRRAREYLLRQSDRILEDAGLSRELLEHGVSAWPWSNASIADDARWDWPTSGGLSGATSADVVPFPSSDQQEIAASTGHDGQKAA